jgi:hypothetical protein
LAHYAEGTALKAVGSKWSEEAACGKRIVELLNSGVEDKQDVTGEVSVIVVNPGRGK